MNKIAKMEDFMGDVKKAISIKGYANHKRLYIKVPPELVGLKCIPKIDYNKMELTLEFGSGNKVVKSTGPTAFGVVTFIGSHWYTKHFHIDEQVVTFNGLYAKVKLSPPVAGVGIRSSSELKKVQTEMPFGAGMDPRQTAKQCIAYLNAYVQQDPEVFKFELVDNKLYIIVSDRLG